MINSYDSKGVGMDGSGSGYYPSYPTGNSYGYSSQTNSGVELDDRISDFKSIINQGIFIFLKKWWIIAIITILVFAATFVYTQFLVTPKYTATSTLYIYRRTDGTSSISAELSLGEQLIKDSILIMKSYRVSQTAVNSLVMNNKPTPEALRGKISCTADEGTRILRLSVTDTDPEKARIYADAVAEAFVSNFEELIGVGNFTQVDYVHVIDQARTPKSASYPNKPANLALGLFIGLFGGAFIVFISEVLDDKIRTPDRIKMSAMVDIIGVISVFDE